MLNLAQFLDTPIGRGVKALSEELDRRGMPPVELNCIGGFALMMHNMRNPQAFTDVDYVGKHLGPEFDGLVDEIGLKNNLGKGWINNDGMLTGASVEDFELSTGKLHFDHAIDVGNVRINVLRQPDLLRMKVISVDTSLMTVTDGATKQFDRSRDMMDIRRLMSEMDLTIEDVKAEHGDLIRFPKTFDAIAAYNAAEDDVKGLRAVDSLLDDTKAEARANLTKKPEGIDETAERQTDLGKLISAGGFSIGSILNMAETKRNAYGRRLPGAISRTDDTPGGPAGPGA